MHSPSYPPQYAVTRFFSVSHNNGNNGELQHDFEQPAHATLKSTQLCETLDSKSY